MNSSSTRTTQLVVSCFTFLFTSTAIAHDGASPADTSQEPIVGCGKARALSSAYWVDRSDPLPPRYLEALSDTDVLHNEIDFEVSNFNPAQNTCVIDGSNRMTIQCKSSSLTEFTFRLRNQYAVTSVLVNDSIPVPVNSISTTTRVVDLSGVTPPIGFDDIFTLTIEYNGNTFSAGFGSIQVSTHSGGIPVVASLSEAYYAYTWWPAKDGDVYEPGDNSDRATLDFSITVPDSFSAPANGVLVSEELLIGDRRKFNWHSDYSIPTYLVAFAGTEYNTWTSFYDAPGQSMPVEFFIYPGNDTASNRQAWEKCIDMMHVFRPLFGEYPFINEKYGIYNFPFGGGMEHQTITGQSGFSERLTAHELGHQWWGDMVTCKTWSDIWLNEGFATYSECLWEENRSGTPDANAYHACMESERPFNVNGSCYVPPEDTDDMSRIFSGNLSYRKGAWVLHQFRRVVGDQVFFQVLADYREAYAFSAASTDDFIAVASATAGQDMTWFFDQWVYQIGAPSYNFGWSTTNVDGQDYLLLSVSQDQSSSYPAAFIMPIELDVTIGGQTEVMKIWNDARVEWFVIPVDGTVTNVVFDPDDWILSTDVDNFAYSAGPPKIVAVEPAPGSSVAPGLTSVSVWLQAPVNVSPSDISVVGQATGVQTFTVMDGTNVNPVVLTMAAPLEADLYTLTITDGVASAVSGLALDGEIIDVTMPLPSGDGEPGGNANLQFIVGGPAAIPAVSSWGLTVMFLLLLTAGSIAYRAGHPLLSA